MQEEITGLITPLAALVFAVTFAVMWRRGRMGNHVLAFALGYVGFGLGFYANLLLAPTAPASFPVGQFFYSAGTVALVWGLCRRAGCQVPVMGMGIAYAVALASLVLAISVTDQLDVPLYLINSGYGAMFVLASQRLADAPRREPVDRLILALMILTAAQFFARPPISLILDNHIATGAGYRETLYFSVLSVFVTVISVAMAMTLIAACIHDLLHRAREIGELDDLSGLASRRAFEDRILDMLDEAAPGNAPLSIIVADLDHFKKVNDIFGHQAGDAAIAAFGKLIADSIRDRDAAGRIGGEEFCIAAWNCSAGDATSMAERLRLSLLSTEVAGMPDGHRLTASFGVAEWRPGESYGTLFSRADRALYAAKNGGRDRIECADGDGATRVVSAVKELRRPG